MSKKKTFSQMTTAQLREATKEFDKEFIPTRPLTAQDKAKHRRARVGRPTIGKGAKIVPVSIEKGLLKTADEFARRYKLKRSQMVAEGLRLVMERRAKAG
jgi:hypothetical protein